ncbi:maleylpyruvate isomerase family mycothiol-dependent enzyme [Saccharopolyspora rhizosphaerae]|uniref:Maleylpyruvate isomerase family mycothiol-dependent enzyme n=1 Tax=Saccharopolyspora rhizosphaerae TaxID=2492662 RepID=A0A3R8V9R6_9PSEU|nr:maleylpyruvate isomerase family mycothiol-dependent enzyme [Saccharopolyspora rhizosphaerae]RRO13095.1 maleylpyruvate isomerase family mycothiol-dependent enzyme [Saccharopolyspora rhizosphaerae]
MDRDFHLKAFQEQGDAFRRAVQQAGPDVEVPSCPGWDVRQLTGHLARSYARARLSLQVEPGGFRPEAPEAPADFDAALSWWDELRSGLLTELSTMDPDRPVWAIFDGGTPTTWARRVAHETAIHRLDAELALGQGGDLVFDPELAADGIDELLVTLLPLGDWSSHQHSGTVLYHAADAGRAWLVTYRPGGAPVIGGPADAGLETDGTVAGTADALYRRVWGRPSTALVTGDHALADVAAGR